MMYDIATCAQRMSPDKFWIVISAIVFRLEELTTLRLYTMLMGLRESGQEKVSRLDRKKSRCSCHRHSQQHPTNQYTDSSKQHPDHPANPQKCDAIQSDLFQHRRLFDVQDWGEPREESVGDSRGWIGRSIEGVELFGCLHVFDLTADGKRLVIKQLRGRGRKMHTFGA